MTMTIRQTSASVLGAAGDTRWASASVAALKGGGWAVVWRQEGTDGLGNIYQSVFGADGSLKATGDVLMADHALVSNGIADEAAPAVTALAEGGWVVAWQSALSASNDYDILQSVYAADGTLKRNADGSAVADKAGVTFALDNQYTPALSALPDGSGWVVAWESYQSNDGNGQIVYSLYGSDGSLKKGADGTTPIAGQEIVAGPPDSKYFPQIAALDGGGWVVVWSSFDPADGATGNLYQSVYDAAGQIKTTVANKAPVSEAPLGQWESAVVALKGGGWVVVWDSDSGAGHYDILLTAYGTDGTPATNANGIAVADDLSSDIFPSIAALDGGGWVVVWESDQGDGSTEVRQAVYASDGTRLTRPGGEIVGVQQGASQANQHLNPKVAVLEGGGWVVTWETDESGGRVYQRVYGVLTAGADEAIGDGDPDVLVAKAGTLSPNDFLDGGAGPGDVLQLAGGGKFDFSGVTVKGFETIALTASATVRGGYGILSTVDASTTAQDVAQITDPTLSPSQRAVLYAKGFETILHKGQTIGRIAGGENLVGSSLADVVQGGAGNDRLFGKAGKDTLTGGAGKDAFVFDTLAGPGNLDTVKDFSVADDSLFLDNAIFKKLGAGTLGKPGKLNASFFKIAAKAQDADDYLVYNKSTGALFYDPDGTGAHAQVQIASLAKNLKLTAADFFVI